MALERFIRSYPALVLKAKAPRVSEERYHMRANCGADCRRFILCELTKDIQPHSKRVGKIRGLALLDTPCNATFDVLYGPANII